MPIPEDTRVQVHDDTERVGTMTDLVLHEFHSSSSSFRVRIALALKGLAYRSVPVELRWSDGEHDGPAYGALNPQRNVPFLVDGRVALSQSLAIMDYLDRIAPEPALFPAAAAARARVWSLALWVACEIQSLNNLRAQRWLAGEASFDMQMLRRWQRHWIEIGFDVLERTLSGSSDTGEFCHGDAPTAADCVLIPQAYNAQRPVVGCDLAAWPTIQRIWNRCTAHPAFERSLPKHQDGFVELDVH